MPARVSRPCRYITRRSVITKCVVFQARMGRRDNQMTSNSQTAPITPATTCRVRGSQSVRLTTAAPNDAAAVQINSASTGQTRRFQCGWRCNTTRSSVANTPFG